jgi:hypothetical protein
MRLLNARRLGTMTSIAMLVSVVIVAIAVMLATQVRPASAEEVGQGRLRVKGPTSGSNTVVMAWHGEIAAPMAAQISEAFEARKASATRFVLLLDSGGGSVAEGERAIDVLRRIKQTHELMTAVAHGHKCGSMCVFIFVQGHERVAALTSAWLFHEVSRMDPNTKRIINLNRPRWEQLIDKYFVPAGISEAWIADMKQYTFGSDYWQTGADLIQSSSGIITKPMGNQRPRQVDPPTAGPSVATPFAHQS